MLTTRPPKTLTVVGPIGCPETSVRNYHSVLRIFPEERRGHLFPLRKSEMSWCSVSIW
jgi:hypothetical protein